VEQVVNILIDKPYIRKNRPIKVLVNSEDSNREIIIKYINRLVYRGYVENYVSNITDRSFYDSILERIYYYKIEK
jgi:hypothetical protein